MTEAIAIVAEITVILVAVWWWERRNRAPRQTTFVYCPKCGMEQIANGCFVEDTDLVTYRCRNCSTETRWDFDAPCPLLIMVNGKMREGEAWT